MCGMEPGYLAWGSRDQTIKAHPFSEGMSLSKVSKPRSGHETNRHVASFHKRLQSIFLGP